MKRRWLNDVAMVALALVGAAAVGRLTTNSTASADAVVAAVVGVVVASAASIRWSAAASFLMGTLAVALASIGVSARRATWHGVPTLTTIRVISRALEAVGAVGHHVPVAPSAGVVLMASLFAGVAAVLTRTAPGVLGLVPALVLVGLSVVALPSADSAWLAVGYVASAALVLASSVSESGGWLAVGGAVLAASACATALIGTAPVSAATGGGPAVIGVPPTALSLVSDLTGLQIHDPDLVLFTATTPVPTYWQVGFLSLLQGDTWVPDPETAGALAGTTVLPPLSASGTGNTFTATITVANLSTRLLPEPPATVAVRGATLTSVGAVSPRPSTPGQRYGVTATIPDPSVPGSGVDMPSLADLVLPALPAAVTSLARSITAAASTPLQKAEAINDYLRSDLFHYSLRSTPASLTAFLTSSRRGSCEQFAGAFTVLARSVGLPTRVAIGFTTGTRDPVGQTVVRGIDAHAWPEVYLNGSWISFEPTPQLPTGEITPPGVVGTAALGNPNPVGSTTIPGSVPPLTTPTSLSPVAAPAGEPGSWWFVGAATGLALLVVLVVLLRRRARTAPVDEVVAAWKRVDRALCRGGLPRPISSTPTAHVRSLRQDLETQDLLDDIEWLASLLERQTYGSRPSSRWESDRARALGHRLTRAIAASAKH